MLTELICLKQLLFVSIVLNTSRLAYDFSFSVTLVLVLILISKAECNVLLRIDLGLLATQAAIQSDMLWIDLAIESFVSRSPTTSRDVWW